MNILKKLVNWFEENKKISLVILFAILGIMFYFSSLPGNTFPTKSILPSVIYHFSIFAGFAFFFAIISSKKKLGKKEVTTVLFVSLLLAVLDEFHQYFVPLRSVSLTDVLVDSTGAICSVILYILIKKSKLN